jgi:Na+-driven multidrug efflux pump
LSAVLSGTALGVNGIWWAFTITTNVAGLLLLIMFPFYMRRHQDDPLPVIPL